MAGCLSEDDVVSYYAGRLDEETVERLEEHVDECVSCRALLDASAPTSPTVPGKPNLDVPRTRARFAPGQLVGGRYRVTRRLGAGGMGEVYEADDEELKERVALKTLLVERAEEPAALDRFRREVQLARKVTHPNVCRVFDVSRHADEDGEPTLFMTMELLEGQSLRQRLLGTGPLPLDEARLLAGDMVAGLGAAHAVGVIHRDFKSDNVQLVVRGGRATAVVTDFGLARSHSEGAAALTASGAFVGTPQYMAPEQVLGKKATAASDIYALGVVMFEMVTGRAPFTGEHALAVASKRLHESPPSPSSLRPDLDPAWDAAILRCMEREPERRFPSVGAVALALASAAPRPRRRWWLAAAAPLVLLAMFFVRHRPATTHDGADAREHARRAASLAARGYEGAAAEEVRLARAGATTLSAGESFEVDLLAARLARDWDRAGELAQARARQHPDDGEAWLRWIAVELEARNGAQALSALAEARPHLAPNDARADVAEAQARSYLRDGAGEAAAADRAARLAHDGGQKRSEAEAQLWQARARANEGKLDEACALVQSAAQIFDGLGDPGEAARALRLSADWRAATNPAAGRAILAAALTKLTALDRQDGVLETLIDSANIERRLGDLPSARRAAERALDLHHKLGRVGRYSALYSLLGEIHLAEGDLAGARGDFEMALEHRRVGQRRNEAATLERLAEVAYQEDSPRVREALDEVLTIWQTEREPAESGRALLLDGRDPARALSSLERAANDLRAAHLADAAACADARRALALFASGRAADARALIAHLDVPNGPWAEDRLDARIALGQARVRLGDGAGQKLIADARGEAAALGYLGRVFEADWALIESGGAEARARAQSLAAETQAHGFLRLHKLAAKLAQP